MRKLLVLCLLSTFCLLADEPAKSLSLKAERSIDFDTDEGTWLSLDVSPDGKTIIFELLGDIYTMPVSGGDAKPLLTGMAFESQPRYSPDGKEIAFLSDRDGSENVWVVAADGTKPRKLSDEKHAEMESPTWTSDGQFVAVSKAGSHLGANEIWLYHKNGAGPGMQMTKSKLKPDAPRDDWNNDLGASFSPDGKYVYFARRKRSFSYNVTFPLWQVVRRNLISGDEDTITNLAGSGFRPLVSPNGKMLVYATRYEQQTALRVRDLTTGDDRWLASAVQHDDQESRATRDLLPGYAFTPDSKSLVLNYGGHIWSIPAAGTQKDAQQIAFKAHVHLDLGPLLKFPIRVDDSPMVRSRLVMEPAWSPDGRQVAFSSFGHLYKADADGKNVARLTSAEEGEYEPSWSPDGQKIVYVTWSAAGGSIKSVPATGGTAATLTTSTAFYRDPVISPDGKELYALHLSTNERFEMESEFGRPQGGLDLIGMPATGGDWRVIVPSRGTGKPHFGPEKDRIYLYGPAGLLSVRTDGSDQRVLLKVVGPNPDAAPEAPAATDVRLNAKGDMALVMLNRELWLIPVPRVGGAETVDLGKPGEAVRRLTLVGADSFDWGAGGQEIYWSLGSTMFHLSAGSVTLKTGEQARSAADIQPQKAEFVVEVPRAKPSGTIVLRGGTAITMKGDEIIPNADIVVTDNRIVAIGKHGQVTIPAGAVVKDIKGETVMPGLVDVHAHWMEVRHNVLDMNAWPMLVNLAYGVTSGRDPQTSTNDMFAYQDLIDAGVIPGPRAYSTGPGIFSYTDFKSADEAKNYVEWYANYYRTNTIKSYTVGNRQQRQWVIEASKSLHLMPTTEGALDLKLDMTHAIDGFSGNEHALPIVPLYRDVVELFARSQISYTPTLLVAYGGPWAENTFFEEKDWYNDPKLRRFFPPNELWLRTSRRPWFQSREQIYPQLAAQAGKILNAGGLVVMGGHGQFQGLQCHWEMWALASGGIAPHDVLKVATINGAKSIGLDQDLGSLEPGKLADLLVLDKSPLDDIRNTNTIRYVMKNGELYEGATLNKVLPKPSTLPALWWWNDRPDGAPLPVK
jgi:Tol biopolymer transport system component